MPLLRSIMDLGSGGETDLYIRTAATSRSSLTTAAQQVEDLAHRLGVESISVTTF